MLVLTPECLQKENLGVLSHFFGRARSSCREVYTIFLCVWILYCSWSCTIEFNTIVYFTYIFCKSKNYYKIQSIPFVFEEQSSRSEFHLEVQGMTRIENSHLVNTIYILTNNIMNNALETHKMVIKKKKLNNSKILLFGIIWIPKPSHKKRA